MEIFFLVILAFVSIILLIAVIYFRIENSIAPALTCFALFCIFVVLWIFSLIDYRENSKPATMYERKVQDVLRAERELQKFLIDHPEFKEEAE
jgi:hypothetical protein